MRRHTTPTSIRNAVAAVAEPVMDAAVITVGLNQVIEYMVPVQALAKQQRYLRRDCANQST